MSKSRDSAAEKRKERQNKSDKGLVQVEIWIKPWHRKELRRLVKLLNTLDTKKA